MNNIKKTDNRTYIPKTIGESLKNINKKISHKLGKIEYTIHINWTQIVGSFFAEHSEPLKISSIQKNTDKDQRTILYFLHVNVSPAAAVEFQHFQDKIIEKINSYFGYKAINSLKIKQNFFKEIKKNKKINKKQYNDIGKIKNELKKQVKMIKNKELEESIIRLGLSIKDEDYK